MPKLAANLTLLFTCSAAGRLRLPPGAILFIEDVGESAYRLDRMVTALRVAGVFDSVAGVVVGQMTDCSSGKYQVSALDALREAIDEGFVSSAPFEIWTIDQDPLLDTLRQEPRYEGLRLEIEDTLQRLRQSIEAAQSTGDWQALRERVIET